MLPSIIITASTVIAIAAVIWAIGVDAMIADLKEHYSFSWSKMPRILSWPFIVGFYCVWLVLRLVSDFLSAVVRSLKP